MMKYLYNLGIVVYAFALRLLSPFNSRAKLWTKGRIEWETRLKENASSNGFNIWIHCASLGEFEQGRPLIEALRKENPGIRILLTFFSPSGYEIRKNYTLADYVCYLPSDTKSNARKFVSIAKPLAAIFVKYEFWDNYTRELKLNKIPVYLISGIFRENQHFFRWYGGFFRKILFRFTHIFVQDENSSVLLKRIGYTNVSVAGDTRFDRVISIASASKVIPGLELFRGKEKLLLAGSSWRPDEEIIAEYINRHPGAMKWAFAPHEIDNANIDRLIGLFKTSVVKFSELNEKTADARVVIINNIGMLSSAYRYSYIAAVGGGFGKGIHNILEAACWEIPVLFGPNHEKFREAVDMIKVGGARTFSNFDEFSEIIDNWLSDSKEYQLCARNAAEYVKNNTGATGKIMTKINVKDINRTLS